MLFFRLLKCIKFVIIGTNERAVFYDDKFTVVFPHNLVLIVEVILKFLS